MFDNLVNRCSQFTNDSIKAAIKNKYSISQVTECTLVSVGINDVYEVTTVNGKYYLRISFGDRLNNRDIQEEVDILISLSNEVIKVANPIADNEGNYIWSIFSPLGERYGVLFTEAKNNPGNLEKCMYNFGRDVAKMHQVSDAQSFQVSREPIDLVQLCINPLKKLEKQIKTKIPEFYWYLCEAGKELCTYIEKLLPRVEPYYGFCHGDLHRGNVFFDAEDPIFFDFDCMGIGWRCYDLIVYLWNKSYDNPDYDKSKEWQKLLEGYNSIRQFTQEEIDAIPAFVALRTIWLMGFHEYISEINGGVSWIEEKYYSVNVNMIKLFHTKAANNKSAENIVTKML